MRLGKINVVICENLKPEEWLGVDVMMLGNGDIELYSEHNDQLTLINIDHETGEVYKTMQNIEDFPPNAVEHNEMRGYMQMSMLRLRKYGT